jgi:hypothetical protein
MYIKMIHWIKIYNLKFFGEKQVPRLFLPRWLHAYIFLTISSLFTCNSLNFPLVNISHYVINDNNDTAEFLKER